MFELSLFPLNTVLFPGMPLALHIFEERYKRMIGECINAGKPFGVVLIKRGTEALGPLADTYLIGCMAQITQVQRLEQGRMNIMAIGRERFRILSLDREASYLIGQVEEYPLASPNPESFSETAEKLRPLVSRYMNELSQLEGVDLDEDQIPEEPLKLAYFGASLLQIPAEQKQTLLSTDEAAEMFVEMRKIYLRELSFVKHMLQMPPEDDSTFSLN
ncbi:MAG: LON peptidase substrate-binding domain-containing protein [Candidatus Promineifilaceae bacterium]